MEFNFWSSKFIKDLEKGELPVLKTEINLSKNAVIFLTLMLIFVFISIIAHKKL